jgi:hypothetical protein
MTAQRQPDELIRAFLDEGPTELPDMAFEAVRRDIHGAHQRAVLGPWRQPIMSNFVRVVLAAAAIGVIALAWVNFGPRQDGVGTPPTPSPTPAESAGPSAATAGSPAPSLMNLSPGPLCTSSGCLTGNLAPGTYSYEPVTSAPYRVTFAVPAGWSSDASGLVTKHTGATDELMFTAWEVTDIYSDACHHDNSALVNAGTTTPQLASALTAQKGRVASATTDARVAGYPAKQLQLTTPADLDVTTCTDGIVRPWPDPGPNFNGGYCCFPAGSIDDLSIVDVAGRRVVFIARHQPGSSAADQAELQSIVDSLTIEPPPGGSAAP